MKLKRGAIRDLHEILGYSEMHINRVLKSVENGVKLQSKGRTKILKAVEIINSQEILVRQKIKTAMAEIDLLYVKSCDDLKEIPNDFLLKKYKTVDRDAIFERCEKRGYY